MRAAYDAVVVGSGPNGLAAAIRLAQEHLSVLVLEANGTTGGGARSAELTRPGFIHDICSAIHPLALVSPFFRQMTLEKHGLHWIQPEVPVAHALAGEQAAAIQRSISETASGLGDDGPAYHTLMAPLVGRWQELADDYLRPMLHFPRHPVRLARFGLQAVRSATGLTNSLFRQEAARALFAGLAAHSFLPLERRGSAVFGLVLAMAAHAVGWPMPRGGSQKISDALTDCLRSLGGEIKTRSPVRDLRDLPSAKATLLDVSPRQLLALANDRLPESYRRRLERFHAGPGVFKLDYALSAPIPWRTEVCRRAGTVHVGGTLAEIAGSEREVGVGRPPERPFVLVTQPSLFDPSRAPTGSHTAWAYCHVPNGSRFDMTERIENQIERFAPGFRDCVLERHALDCAGLEAKNPNLVGGDISGGATNLWQLLSRPVLSRAPYRTPVPGLYLCSASTPPGGGVHGMCGFHAAEIALRDCFRR